VSAQPEVRPGLPREAALIAAYRGQRLTYGEALLDAREHQIDAVPDLLLADLAQRADGAPIRHPVDGAVVAMLVTEVRYLRTVAADRMTLLEDAADHEAREFDRLLRYPLVRLANDTYIPWSGSVEAPTGTTLTAAQALDRGWIPKRIADARTPSADGYLHNGAGPGGKSLTVAAIIEAFASDEAYRAFRLTPAKVQCSTTSGRTDPGTGAWDDETVYWTPWHPDETPEVLPADWKDRY
jgi:hypothetical protein